MRIMPSMKPALALVAGLMLAQTAPAMAQDGLGMWRMLGAIGLVPKVDRDPIEYRDRPSLVVPKDRQALRNPENPEAHAQNPSWPVDPDVEERKAEIARRNAPAAELLGNRTVDGRRMSIDEIRAGRAQRGAVMGEPHRGAGNDKTGVRIGPDEWAATQQVSRSPGYAPGTEPPRVYLTDPPRGLRQPAANAPMVRTKEEPTGFDNFRPSDTWRRLD